jgi:hypothetical protein
MEVTEMERNDVAAICNKINGLLDEFAQMWRNWGIDTQPIATGLWLIKYGGNVLRPLEIRIIPPTEFTLPRVLLNSNEKIERLQAHKIFWRYFRSYFERLTEYLVIEAAQVIAIEKTKIYIRKSGKHLYLQLPIEEGDFKFSFTLRRKDWIWTVWRWRSGLSWTVMDRIYRPLNENPIEMFISVVSNIGLKLL